MEKRIAVDAMGGDNAPLEIVKGAVEALKEVDAKLILVGMEDAISAELSKYKYDKSRITVVNATQVIDNNEVPTTAIKKKKDSSIVVGLKMLKEEKADAFVSAGCTGALLIGATVIAGRIKGIERPALATLLPNEKGFSLMLDSGANADAKPTYFPQFAKMGSVYMEHVIGVRNPRVGLVNIGAEKEKGNQLTKDAYDLLEEAGVNFIGNVEAREIPHGGADVIVCDAFVGNIILKYTEGFASAFMNMMKKELMSSTKSKIGAMLAKDAFKSLKNNFDYSEVGGAPLLGLNALVVKAHGSSDSRAIKGAIKQCDTFIANEIVDKIRAGI